MTMEEENVIRAAMAVWQVAQRNDGTVDPEGLADGMARACEALYMARRAKCRACAIEKEIGTVEVPHPVDSRLHACLEGGTGG